MLVQQPLSMSFWAGPVKSWIVGLFGMIFIIFLNLMTIIEVNRMGLPKSEFKRTLIRKIYIDNFHKLMINLKSN